MLDELLLKSEEKAIFSLRSLYKKYGYLPYKMSKFEEYDLYMKNKDFLVSDRIIAFNDTKGRMLALKPDVTLSIIKNSTDECGFKQKVYYNENVYRVSESTDNFKEIMQAGLECIGDIDLYDIFEVISLAAKSLSLISESFVLEISHLDILSSVLSSVLDRKDLIKDAMKFISEKNSHDLMRLCKDNEIDDYDCNKILSFVNAYGDRWSVIKKLESILGTEYEAMINELKSLSSMIDKTEFSDKVIFDFSVVNDMNYYNGFVFKGFLSGICEGVLAGGQYDNMMRKMKRKSGAIGFAIYIDLLEQLAFDESEYDVDTVVLYNDKTPIDIIASKVSELVAKGCSVSAQRNSNHKLRYKTTVDLRG